MKTKAAGQVLAGRAAGIGCGLLAAFAPGIPQTQLAIGSVLGVMGAFAAAQMSLASPQGAMMRILIRSLTVLLLPPVGALICLLRSRELAAGFTLWGLMTWGLALSLLASDRQRRTGE